jgi:homoserine dehydrogenase
VSTPSSQIVVLKFGSSVLPTPAALPVAVAEIYRHYREGRRVIAVVSAFQGVTDLLWQAARGWGDDPDPRTLAALLSTGEIASAAELTLALKRAGVRAHVADPRELELVAEGDRSDAALKQVLVPKILNLLAEVSVLIVPGFFARHEEGGLALLGRGGTDLTAVFLAAELRARCILLKDVDGLYESDPAHAGAHPRRYLQANYETAERQGGPLIQRKAVRLARQREIPIEVARPGGSAGTLIGALKPNAAVTSPRQRPIRVALLGLGTVGGGVLEYLQQFREGFEVVAALVRRPEKYTDRGLEAAVLTSSLEEVFARAPEIVVEALPALEPARTAIKRSLYCGARIVTANKALLAEEWPALTPHLNSTIRFAASVGGAVPMIEAIERLKGGEKIVRLRGVMSGTVNFVLDRCAAGDSLVNALRVAQAEGLTEADPTEDLSGRDSARKIEILGRLACGGFPVREEPAELTERAILSCGEAAPGTRLRLVAEAMAGREGFNSRVVLHRLPTSDFLAGARGAENRLEITTVEGRLIELAGLGAGRFPTATAMFADILEHALLIDRREEDAEPFDRRRA